MRRGKDTATRCARSATRLSPRRGGVHGRSLRFGPLGIETGKVRPKGYPVAADVSRLQHTACNRTDADCNTNQDERGRPSPCGVERGNADKQ